MQRGLFATCEFLKVISYANIVSHSAPQKKNGSKQLCCVCLFTRHEILYIFYTNLALSRGQTCMKHLIKQLVPLPFFHTQE